jgi:hypothetical protein
MSGLSTYFQITNLFVFNLIYGNDNYFYGISGNVIYKVDIYGNYTIFSTLPNDISGFIFDNVGFPLGYLYVGHSNNIYKIDSTGSSVIFKSGIACSGIVLDSSNNVYVGDNSTSVIRKIDNATLNVSTFATGVQSTIQLRIDTNGNIYSVSDTTITNYTKIAKYNSFGTLVDALFYVSSIGSFSPSITFDSVNNYYVTTYLISGIYVIKKYDSNNNFVETIFQGITNEVLANNLIVSFDSSGNLYFGEVSLQFDDTYNMVVYKYEVSPPPPPPPPFVCFKEDSKILTDTGYKPIQELRKGDLVKTLCNGFKAVDMIGFREIEHVASSERIKDQLYKCSNDNYTEVFEDLVITGCHSILVNKFASEEQKQTTMETFDKIYVTDRKYRLPACVDERAKVYEIPGKYTIYHLALENENYYSNYGIFANGLLVETCSRRYLKELSNMTLID